MWAKGIPNVSINYGSAKQVNQIRKLSFKKFTLPPESSYTKEQQNTVILPTGDVLVPPGPCHHTPP